MAKTKGFAFTRLLLVVSLLANLATVIYFVRKQMRQSTFGSVAPPNRPSYYLDRNKLFEVLPADTNAVVFLGNSLTQYFELAEFFPGKRVKNRGIHGDMLEKALRRLGPIVATKPEKIFIELGVNDAEQNVPIDRFLLLYGRLLDTLKTA